MLDTIIYKGYVISRELEFIIIYHRGSFVRQFERVYYQTFPQKVSEAVGWIDDEVKTEG